MHTRDVSRNTHAVLHESRCATRRCMLALPGTLTHLVRAQARHRGRPAAAAAARGAAGGRWRRHPRPDPAPAFYRGSWHARACHALASPPDRAPRVAHVRLTAGAELSDAAHARAAAAAQGHVHPGRRAGGRWWPRQAQRICGVLARPCILQVPGVFGFPAPLSTCQLRRMRARHWLQSECVGSSSLRHNHDHVAHKERRCALPILHSIGPT